MNDRSANDFATLELHFSIPEDLCLNDEADSISCQPDMNYWKYMSNKSIFILEN